jgi:hypothetical protein
MQGLSCRYVHSFRELRAAALPNFDIVIAWTQMHFFVLLRAGQTATPTYFFSNDDAPRK